MRDKDIDMTIFGVCLVCKCYSCTEVACDIFDVQGKLYLGIVFNDVLAFFLLTTLHKQNITGQQSCLGQWFSVCFGC